MSVVGFFYLRVRLCLDAALISFISQKVKLLASKKTFNAYTKLFNMVIGAYNAYDIYFTYKKGSRLLILIGKII